MGALSSRAVGIPRRLDESLERLEQGDLQLQIRTGESDRLDPAFSLVGIAKPYLLPLMTSSGSGSNDLFNELGRQVGALSSRAVGIPRRLDESLERLEQGDLQLQIRTGESDRQFRRMVVAQHSIGQSVPVSYTHLTLPTR